jgi:hypothetical protein
LTGLRASVRECGSALPLFHRRTVEAKAAEDCRSPKPRGLMATPERAIVPAFFLFSKFR